MWLRLGLLAVLLVGTYVVAWATGIQDHLTLEGVRDTVEAWGFWGWLGYLGLFAGGELIHIPGLVFVAAGILVYGQVVGGVLSFAGSIVSISVSFLVVRGVGGKPLTQLRWRFARRILAQLDDHPIRTVFLLRLFFFMAPPLNYALALSGVKFRDYFVGSVLGLIAPIAGVVLAFDWVIAVLLTG
jgi:uncharacterized membrane protein YdjX (TVP38/TMEM64 family)